MGKHKLKIIAGIFIVAILATAWIYGESIRPNVPDVLETSDEIHHEAYTPLLYTEEKEGESYFLPLEVTPEENPEEETVETPEETPIFSPSPSPTLPSNPSSPGTPSSPTPPSNPSPPSTPGTRPPTPPSPSPPPIPTPPPAPGVTVPEDDIPDTFTVSLSVRVDMILSNMDMLSEAQHSLIPANGIIFSAQVTANRGDTVFDVLQREMRSAGIHMSSRFTPIFNSAYVEAIHNIFEFDVGPLSGWMYRVNGVFPNFGSSLFEVSPGDSIAWLYTVDLGRDLGAPQGQR